MYAPGDSQSLRGTELAFHGPETHVVADGHTAAIQGLPGIRALGTGGLALLCCIPPQTLLPFGGAETTTVSLH